MEVVSCSKGGHYTSNKKKNKKSPSKLTQISMGPSGEPSIQQEAKQNAPLTDEFDKEVRPYIDLIDNLRQYGLDEDVRLPAVAVIGDQSAGKSSTLEAISGIQLPRGSGIVTRCPLNLILKSRVRDGEQWRGYIRYKDCDNEKHEIALNGPSEVGEAVEEAQNRIAGYNKGISKELITVEVESQNVPDLTLIDLPGITRIATLGQPSNVPDQIKGLIRERIKRDETIILAVIPANVDIETTEALQMAQEFDPHGERTLGVVTKPDLIDRGTESELIGIINNDRWPLTKGYTVVKCRGQQDITNNQTLEMALQTEEDFFKDTPHFQEVDQSLLGVKNLSHKLTEELVTHIKKTLPHLKEQVKDKIELTEETLEKLGQGLPEEDTEKRYFLVKLLTRYCDQVMKVCNGDYNDIKKPEYRLFTKARQCFKELLEAIAKQTPDFTSTYYEPIQQQASTSSGGFTFGSVNRSPVTPLIFDGFSTNTGRTIPSDTIGAATLPTFGYKNTGVLGGLQFNSTVPSTHVPRVITDISGERNPAFVKKIMKAMEDHRGDELPRFMNYKVCKSLIQEIISSYTKHATYCLNRVEDLVGEIFAAIARDTFCQFPLLETEVKFRVNKLKVSSKDTSKQRIDEIFQMEKLVFTQDRIFNHDLDIEKWREEGPGDEEYQPLSQQQRNDMEKDLLRKLSRGHQIANASAVNQGESDVKKQQARDMYSMIRAYLEVSTRRLVDNIPLTIQLHLIKNLSEKIHLHIHAMATEPKTLEMMVEHHKTAEIRRVNKLRLERLEKADIELSKF